MIIKGRCRGNGPQLADYLTNSKENERAQVIGIIGTATPDDLKRSLLEMSLTSEMTGKTDAGIYHAQISPRADEAAIMTLEQKLRAVEILAEHLGLKGKKCVIVEHEKDGRIHLHAAWERYDHATGIMWKDDQNYAKHKAAARAMEMEFGHQITHDKTNQLDKDIKAHILNLWNTNQDPADFIKAMDKAGFEVTQGIDKRPYQIVDQHGTVHDLSRQLKGVKQADVAEQLNSIRSDLRTTTEASKDNRRDQQQATEREPPAVTMSDNLRELSDSQDMAAAMLKHQKQKAQPTPKPPKVYSYSFSFTQAPALPYQPQPVKLSDNVHELSDSQDLAAAMIERHKKRQSDQMAKMSDAKQQATDNQNDITNQAAKMLEDYKRRQDEIKQKRDRDRGSNLNL